ncbi:unnamed protein product [Closterium sp. NIES-54]
MSLISLAETSSCFRHETYRAKQPPISWEPYLSFSPVTAFSVRVSSTTTRDRGRVAEVVAEVVACRTGSSHDRSRLLAACRQLPRGSGFSAAWGAEADAWNAGAQKRGERKRGERTCVRAGGEWATEAERADWEKRQRESGGGGGGGGNVGGEWRWTLNWSRIAPGIIVGSCPRSPSDVDRIVDESGATAVVNLQSDLCFDALQIPIAAIREQAVQRGLRLERVPIRDFDHGDQAFMLPVAVRMVNLLIAEGCDVYIHCTAGINRATLTALGYLTFIKGMDLDSALSQIRQARPIAHPYLDCWHSVKGRLLAGREEEQMALATEIYEERSRSGGGGNASADWQQAQARVIQRTFDRYLQVDQGIIRSHKGVLQFAIKEQRAKQKEKRLANLAALASLSQEEERLAELQAQVRAHAQTVKRTRWEALRLQLEAQRVEGQALLLQCARPDGEGAIVEKQLVE